MLTEKDYCDYDTCVALKELGYKVPTSAYYMPNNNQLIFVSNPFRGGSTARHSCYAMAVRGYKRIFKKIKI